MPIEPVAKKAPGVSIRGAKGAVGGKHFVAVANSSSVLEHARLLEKGGDLLQAYDILVEGLASHPDDVDLKHRAVLMLARAGATEHARREFQRLGLEDVEDHEDVLALGGRLLKDLSLSAKGDNRRIFAEESARKYAKAYALKGGYYPGINLATMTLLAGDADRAVDIARDVMKNLAGQPEGAESYYTKATAAEAHLLRGEIEQSDDALAAAISLDPQDYAAHASTLRQFVTICRAQGRDASWLDRHRPPPALFYCGHMFPLPGAYDEILLTHLQNQIDEAIARICPGAVFGALAAGADILIAEAALRSGAELHVILPMREMDFLAQSVAPFGESWIARFHDCLHRATTYRLAAHEPFLDDDNAFAYSTELAMGLSVGHAETLQTRAELLAVWDGIAAAGKAGTGADVARWNLTGRKQTIIEFPAPMRKARAMQTQAAEPAHRTVPPARKLKAMLFGDVRGFSKLTELQIKPFVDHVLSPLAEELRGLPVQPEEIATWGDGLYIVYDDVGGAASGALALLHRFNMIDLAAAGLPDHLALRIGGHAGPVIPITDPFMGTTNFFGTHVTLAARIEPVTMPGSFYVSEPFAAQLGLTLPGRYQTSYVGQTELAKKFGSMRLFAVTEA